LLVILISVKTTTKTTTTTTTILKILLFRSLIANCHNPSNTTTFTFT